MYSQQLVYRGDCEDYAKMLKTVGKADDCTPQLIIAIAEDIAEHSDEQDIKINLSLENIAFYLCEDVMHTGLELDDREGNASSLFFFLNYKIEILFYSQQFDVLNKS